MLFRSGLSGWPDTAFAGDSIPVGGYLKNYSNNFFNDTLMIQGYVDTGAAPVPFLIDYSYLWPAFSIAPSDSQFVILPISFEPGNTGGYFHVGNNVVVVWPISVGPDSFRTNDSIFLNVLLIDTINSIGPEYPPANVRIYPVPANGPLYINSYHPQYQVTTVVIRNAMGQIVYSAESAAGPINTEEWAPGLYTVETTLSNGQVGYYKILRQ